MFGQIKRKLRGNVPFRKKSGKDVRLAVDVPKSRKEILMQRRRMTIAGLKIAGAATLVIGCTVWLHGLWDRGFRTNRAYSVGQFTFVTNGIITSQEAANAAGLRQDMNVVDVDLAATRARLLELPRVLSATVERRLPNSLSIRLDERRPVAWLSCSRQGIDAMRSSGLLVDADGMIFRCGTVISEYALLPEIKCDDLSSAAPGRKIGQPLVQTTLALLENIRQRRWPDPVQAEKIHLTDRFTITVQTDQDALLTFRPENLDLQLDRLYAILEQTHRYGRRVSSVNLKLARNIPVTFDENARVRTPAPTSPQTAPVSGKGGARTAPRTRSGDAGTILRGV